MTGLLIEEVIQAGDVFLVKFNCISCGQEALSGANKPACASCSSSPVFDYFDLPKGRSAYRLLAGTKRKKKISKQTIQYLLDLQGKNCAYCRIALDLHSMQVDHIFPVSLGGSNHPDNLCLSCPRCNKLAGQKEFKDFEAKKAYVQSALS